MDVRPIDRDELQRWLRLSQNLSQMEDDLSSFNSAMETDDPRCFLAAVDAGRFVGRLHGRFLNAALYFIKEIRAADGVDVGPVASAFASFLLHSFSRERTEILSWDRNDSRTANSALEDAGFVVGREKVFVEKDIEGYVSPYRDECDHRTLVEVGEDRYIEIMSEAAVGDPFENPEERDARRDFRDLIEYAGERYDPTWWRVAFIEGRPAGVVLPQAFAGPAQEGTLFYVGVVPERRGRGLGRTLHAGGMEFLAAKGIKRYVGSTDSRNLPMLAVFAANGCVQTGTQLFYKPLRRVTGAFGGS